MTTLHSIALVLQDVGFTRPDGTVVSGTAPSMSYFDGGITMYPITFCALMVLVLTVRAAWRLWGGDGGAPHASRMPVDGILFWGAYAVVLGVLGTAVGIAIAAQAVEAVGVVETRLVWGGLRSAIVPTIVGLLYFLIAALLWFGLWWAQRKQALQQAAA